MTTVTVPRCSTGPRRIVSAWARVLALAILASGCATVDFDYPRETSHAIAPAADTTLKRAIDAWLEKNPGPSGFYPLGDGSDALAMRLRLIGLAEKSIDAQYFLMKPDPAGFAFGAALYRAADWPVYR